MTRASAKPPPADGDTIFAIATGMHAGPANVAVIGLAADVMAQAILRSVRQAEGLPGIPSVRDLAAPKEQRE